MNKFETYLIDNGIHFQVAGRNGRIVDKYLEWLKANNLKVGSVKRSQFTDWLQQCREQGNKENTIIAKESVIKQYYAFLGTKNNPALSWIKRKKEHTLPSNALEKTELIEVYKSLKPKSPSDYRNRCMLGFVLFQGLKRSELAELRIQDIDFEGTYFFVQGQRRTNSRRLKLEPEQVLHLYEYLNKYRKDFLAYKTCETDRFFLSNGNGSRLNNSVTLLLYKLRQQFPKIENLIHIRSSVITRWQEEVGIMEAMDMAGHRYISSTQRYQTGKYEELQEQLKNIHPLENMNLNLTFDSGKDFK